MYIFQLNWRGIMKKLLFILLILVFASSAWATVYKWVDQGGVVNFADDYSKVPPDYRNKIEEVNITRMEPSTPPQALPGKTIVGAQSGEERAKQAPPIAQTLIREGGFAIKLAEALKMGRAESEAEAESTLASVGIAPKNGWIADYPMTPDIIGELEKAVSEAADAKSLPIGKNEALKALRTTAVELELPIIAEIPDKYTEAPPPTTPQYTTPAVINNYYYSEGPPVVTYYPPPWDYYYMYAWIPSPFWCSGFYFPGFFVLRDFHRVISFHNHRFVVTNHIRDHRTGRIFSVDPARRHSGGIYASKDTPQTRGLNSTGARNGARSILERSRDRAGSVSTSMPITGRGTSNRNPAYPNSGRGNEKQVYNRGSTPSGFNGRNSIYARPPVIDQRMNRSPGETRPRGIGNMTFNRQDNVNRQSGPNFQRPPVGQTRSFSPPSRGGERFSSPQGGERSFSPSPQARGQHFSSAPTGGKGFFGSHQGGNYGSGVGHGGPRF
jgi:hypothetical protein